jgi:spore coat polysaccharide biosynthesis protein SpsF (cytidylyltransferase family)
MKTGAIILARMRSTRLPGKALMDLAGVPVIDRVVRRARRLKQVSEIVVATTSVNEDDPLARHCARLGLRVFRGAEDNVAQRVLTCAESHGWRQFVRINGDSPFLDPDLIDNGIRRLVTEQLDIVTNVQPRTYPYGIAVEVFRTAAYRSGYERMREAAELEHVSRRFYAHNEEYRIGHLPLAGCECADVRLTIDTLEDLHRAAALVEHLGPDEETATWREVVAAYRACQQEQASHAKPLART